VSDPEQWITLGRVAGAYGLSGWVKLISETRPRESIFQYQPLYLQRQGRWDEIPLEGGQPHGKGLIAKFQGVDDRDVAAALNGSFIGIRRSQLPAAEPDEYYWADLEGLRVITLDDVELGKVTRLFETGSNDVLVIQGDRERLLPFIQGQVVQAVDLQAGILRVDWDPDF